MNTISYSQLDAQSCRFAWYLAYRQGYRSKRSSPALEFGTGVHYAMEMYYGKKRGLVESFSTWIDKRTRKLAMDFPESAEALLDMKPLGEGMLEGYLEEYKGKDNFEVLATEQNLSRPLPAPTDEDEDPNCSILARLDGLIRDDQTGKLFSLEHKTFSSFSLDFMDRDAQFSAQVFVGQAIADNLGIKEKLAGVLYNGLRKQLPSPKVKNRLFERHKIYRNQNQIKIFLHRAYHQYMENKNPHIFPQPNMVRCSQCDFKDVCRAYMLGEDWRFILKEQYTRHTKI